MAAKRERRKHERERRGPDSAAGRRVSDVVLAAVHAAATQAARNPPTARAVATADAVRAVALTVMQKSASADRHACRAGCAYCCHTAITAAPPELFAIAEHLRNTIPPDKLEAVRARLRENAARARELSREDYIASLTPCALLTEDGNCRAHPVRPLACAGFVSTSRAACEQEFRREFGREPIPVDRFAMLVGLAASAGLAEHCGAAGLDGQFYELSHALLRILDEPDAARRWAEREPVFAGCPT